MTIERCHITFENYWGEELKNVLILTEELGFLTPTKEMYLYNVKDKQVIPDAVSFYYRVGGKHSWIVYFVTQDDQKWRSKPSFSCQITPEDNHHITLGINGESKRLYAAFPSSKSCATDLYKI